MFPAVFDLSWILTALWLSEHQAVPLALTLAVYLLAWNQPFTWWRKGVLLVALGAAIWLGSVPAAMFGLVALAASRLRASRVGSTARAGYLTAVVAWAVLALVAPPLQAVLLAVAVAGLVAQRKGLAQTLGPAAGTALAALVLAVGAVWLLWAVPWDAIAVNTLGRLGGLVVGLIVSLIPPLRARKPSHYGARQPRELEAFRHHAAPSPHIGADVMTAAAALILVALVVWILRRRPARLQSVAQEAGGVQVHIEALLPDTRQPEHPGRLSPLRQLVRQRLAQARRRGWGLESGQTLRQWLAAHYKNPPAGDIANLYDSVRYGGQSDTREQAQTARQMWVKEALLPRPDGPTPRAPRNRIEDETS